MPAPLILAALKATATALGAVKHGSESMIGDDGLSPLGTSSTGSVVGSNADARVDIDADTERTVFTVWIGYDLSSGNAQRKHGDRCG